MLGRPHILGFGLILVGLLFFPTPLPLGVPFLTAGALVLAKESAWVQRRLAALLLRYPKTSRRLLEQTRVYGPAFMRGLVDDFLVREALPDPDGDVSRPSGTPSASPEEDERSRSTRAAA